MEVTMDKQGARQRGGPHGAHILHAVALMAANGAQYADIEAATGVKLSTLKRWIAERSNDSFNSVIDGYRKNILKRTTEHQYRLLGLLDKSYGAVDWAMTQRDDPRVAKETAMELWDRLMPSAKPSPNVNVQVGFQNINVHNELQATFNKVGEKFASLIERITDQNPNQFIRDTNDGYEVPMEVEPVEERKSAQFGDDPADS